MTNPIIIRITGHPVPQGRPRMAVVAGHAMAYKPAKSRRWEQDARLVARQVMGTRKPLTGCLQMTLIVYLVPPQSWPDWKRAAALGHQIRPTGKPDLSNFLKAAEDALNGVAWGDDAQIVYVVAGKFYATQPSVFIEVVRISARTAQITRKSELEAR